MLCLAFLSMVQANNSTIFMPARPQFSSNLGEGGVEGSSMVTTVVATSRKTACISWFWKSSCLVFAFCCGGFSSEEQGSCGPSKETSSVLLSLMTPPNSANFIQPDKGCVAAAAGVAATKLQSSNTWPFLSWNRFHFVLTFSFPLFHHGSTIQLFHSSCSAMLWTLALQRANHVISAMWPRVIANREHELNGRLRKMTEHRIVVVGGGRELGALPFRWQYVCL